MAAGFKLTEEKHSVFGLTILSFEKLDVRKNTGLSFTFYNDTLAQYIYSIYIKWKNQPFSFVLEFSAKLKSLWLTVPKAEYAVRNHHGLSIFAVFEDVYADYYQSVKNGHGNMTLPIYPTTILNTSIATLYLT